MNPDGTEIATRESCSSKIGRNNSFNIDLNRNFPDAFFCNDAHLEPETVAVLEWMNSMRFLLSATFHTGALVTSYGYENWPQSQLAQKPRYMVIILTLFCVCSNRQCYTFQFYECFIYKFILLDTSLRKLREKYKILLF